ncbi:hypothetical protein C1646_822438 [Rhizophagus diaphanus]|nr:hypothetical protein C1646_822438 [Rhizophagus diaphanus] [Rhizophagus sp. MUCL 43196]
MEFSSKTDKWNARLEEFKISDDAYEQIKDFSRSHLTEEQELLVDKLILNEEIKERYKEFGLCKDENWTSGNPAIDKFIQNVQLKANLGNEVIEWAEYNDLENFEHLAKGGFGTVYKAKWKQGYIAYSSQDNIAEFLREANIKEEVIEWVEYNDLENVEYLAKGGFGIVYKAIWRQGKIHTWNFDSNRWKRDRSQRVVLKYIYNSQDNIAEFLREVESHVIANLGGSRGVIRCYGITKNPEKNEYMMIMQHEINALEVLRGKEYTQASDIYGFGIIAYEVCTGLSPYHDIAHNRTLAI